MEQQRVGSDIVRWLRTSLLASVALLAVAVLTPERTQAQQIVHVCLIPGTGTLYIINREGVPQGCVRASHIPFAWNQVGPPGADGIGGATGAIGPAGADGADGARGATGPAGADGADGATGAIGPAGPDGADGATGPAGADGADGATGAIGPAGSDGVLNWELNEQTFTGLSADATRSVSCTGFKVPLGGGWSTNDPNFAKASQASFFSGDGEGFTVSIDYTNEGTYSLTVQVTCATRN